MSADIKDQIIANINKYAWMALLVGGIISLIAGIYFASVWGAICAIYVGNQGLYNTCMATLIGENGVYLIIGGICGIVSGLFAKMKAVPAVNKPDYKAAEKPLLIAGIIGCVFYGAGVALLIEFVLIKMKK